MYRRMLLGLVASVSLPLGAAWGQEEEARIVGVAGRFLRDSLQSGPIVVDATMFRAPRNLSPAVADRVAADIGGTRGRVADVLRCTTPQAGRRRTCTMRGGATVVAFARPGVRTDTATLDVLTVYQFSPGRTSGFSAELILVRTPTGDWRVQEMRRTGAS
jgi:hypothetical protein